MTLFVGTNAKAAKCPTCNENSTFSEYNACKPFSWTSRHIGIVEGEKNMLLSLFAEIYH